MSLGEDTWDRDKVELLLNGYLERLHKFKNSHYVKKVLWDEIGATLDKTGESCDKKFRNLKQTYIKLLKNTRKFGRTSVRWPHFDMFNKIFSNGLDIKEPEICIIQSLDDIQDETAAVTMKRQFNITNRKRKYQNIYKMTEEVREKQKIIEDKLDHMMSILEESNNIQKERNYLFQQYLEAMLNKTL